MDKPVELPHNVIGAISVRNHGYRHLTAYLFYELGTLNFYQRDVKDKKYYRCRYSWSHSSWKGPSLWFYDIKGKKQLSPLRYFLTDYNKQTNGEFFKEYPNLELMSSRLGCFGCFENTINDDETITFTWTSPDKQSHMTTTQMLLDYGLD